MMIDTRRTRMLLERGPLLTCALGGPAVLDLGPATRAESAVAAVAEVH